MNEKDLRLDILMLKKGLVQSREKAKRMVLEGIVYVDGNQVTKPSKLCSFYSTIEIKCSKNKYVSRGGLKLEKALKEFDISVSGLNCADIGASTGGFTDCLLKNECNAVYCIDVGTNQLDDSLKHNKRVVNLENTNIRYIEKDVIKHDIDFFTIDVSFISLKLVLPAVSKIIKDEAYGVCLVKPQFEAGKKKLSKNGVVRDKKVHIEVLSDIFDYCAFNGFSILGLSYSPIKGPAGNIEYLIHVRKDNNPKLLYKSKIAEIVEKSHNEL